MDDRIERYKEFIKKVPKGKKINNRTVSEAMGVNPSLLNPGRYEKDSADYAINEIIRKIIEDAEAERLNKDNEVDKLAEETRIKKRWKKERDEFKNKLENAYAREVMLISRIHELETELAQYKNEKGMKLATKRN
jgi:hypothetical protein